MITSPWDKSALPSAAEGREGGEEHPQAQWALLPAEVTNTLEEGDMEVPLLLCLSPRT